MKLFRKEEGFTLVELMVVVLIIGILVAIAIPVFNAASASARKSACQANLRTLDGATEQYLAADPDNTRAQIDAGAPGHPRRVREGLGLLEPVPGRRRRLHGCRWRLRLPERPHLSVGRSARTTESLGIGRSIRPADSASRCSRT